MSYRHRELLPVQKLLLVPFVYSLQNVGSKNVLPKELSPKVPALVCTINIKSLPFTLDGPAIRNANRGDSRELIRTNRFAEKNYFHNVRAICSNRLKTAMHKFCSAPKRDAEKKKPIFITFERFARIASKLRVAISVVPRNAIRKKEGGSVREPSSDSCESGHL